MSRAAEHAQFNRLLATIAERGLPLAQALGEAGGQGFGAAMLRAIDGAKRAVAEGKPLSDALALSPDVFPPEYCALLAAAEKSGDVAAVARGVEQEYVLRAQLAASGRRLMIYVALGMGACGVVLGMLSTVSAHFRRMFEQLGMRELPLPTEAMFAVVDSGCLSIVVMMSAGLAFFAAFLAARAVVGRTRLLYMIPLVGRLARARDLALLCTTLGLRLKAAAPLPDALGDAARTTPNWRFRELVRDLQSRVRGGDALSDALFYQTFFPRALAWGVSLGESRSDLAGVLQMFGDLYARETRRGYDVLFVVLTPLAFILLGNFVFLFVMGVFLPIIEIQKKLAG